MKLFGRRKQPLAFPDGYVPPSASLTPPKPTLTGFLWDRIKELEDVDPDGAEQCRRVIDDCCDQIDISMPDSYPRYVRGAVKDWGPLLKLARNWSDHPDFRLEWETP